MIDQELKQRALTPAAKGEAAPREKILKLGKKITDVVDHKLGKVRAEDAEYWGLAGVVTDEMADIAIAAAAQGARRPAIVAWIARHRVLPLRPRCCPRFRPTAPKPRNPLRGVRNKTPRQAMPLGPEFFPRASPPRSFGIESFRTRTASFLTPLMRAILPVSRRDSP